MSARTARARRERGEAGISTVEVVIAVPVMMVFFLICVGCGFYAEDVSKVREAAADAARMASVQNPANDMTGPARKAAWADLQGTCTRDDQNDLPITPATMRIQLPSKQATGTTSAQSFTEVVQITVTCDFTLFGQNLSLTESSYAPFDYFREQR
nr:TadE/TadG family type IV pilus assembly protein [Actinospica robiniae]